MSGFTFHWIAVTLLALAVPGPVPRPREQDRTADFAKATAGLTPFTPETNHRSLEEFWRLLHPLKADLVITRVVLSPAQPKVGDLIGATIYYKNIGGKQADQFDLHQEPGTLGKGGFGLGGDYARLAPGEEKQYLWGAITATKVGMHRLTFSIDSQGSVPESNRRNNRHSVPVWVAPP